MRNALQLHIVNKRSDTATYDLEVEAADGMTVVMSMPAVTLPALSDTRVPVFLSIPRERFRQGFPVRVHVLRADDRRDSITVAGTFLGPSS